MEKKCFDYAEGMVSAIFSLTLVFFLIGLIGKHYPSYPFYDEKLTDYFTVFLTSLTIFATITEYKEHRKRVKAEVLGQYNERYSRDEHVNKVVNYLISHIESKVSERPSTHNIEMFMRFFEEMKLQIDEDRLNLKDVEELFSYYPIYLDAKPGLLKSLCIDDYDSNNWKSFHGFVEKMTKIRLLGSEWKCVNDNWPNIIFDYNGRISINNDFYEYHYKKGIIVINDYLVTYYLAGMLYNDEVLEKDILVRENREYHKL